MRLESEADKEVKTLSKQVHAVDGDAHVASGMFRIVERKRRCDIDSKNVMNEILVLQFIEVTVTLLQQIY